MESIKFYFIWFLFFFTSFEGLGLRQAWWGGMGTSTVGWYGMIQWVAFVFSFTLPLFSKGNIYFQLNKKLGWPILTFTLLLLVIVVQSIYLMWSGNLLPVNFLTNFVKLKYLFLLYPFIFLLSTTKGVAIAIKSFQIYAVLSAVIVIVVFLTGYDSQAIRFIQTDFVGREFRVILPTTLLIAFAFFYFLSKFRFENKVKYILGAILCLLPTVMQMHRTVIISLLVTLLFSMFKLYMNSLRTLGIVLIGLFGGILVVFNKIGYTMEMLTNNLFATREELMKVGGNFGIRVFLVVNSFWYTIKNYFVIGVGFKWEVPSNFEKYLRLRFVAGPTLDSGYANIIIVFGLLGIFIYSFIVWRMFVAVNILLKLPSHPYNPILYSVLFTSVYLLITAVSGDNFLLYNSAFIFYFMFSLVYSIERILVKKDVII